MTDYSKWAPMVPAPLERRAQAWPWACQDGTSVAQGDTVGLDFPRITVVTPSYNQGEYLEEAIRSVLLQGYPNLEYFVIDGGSTDGSLEVISHYRSSLTGAVSEPDRGQVHAINKGFAIGSGDIFCWLNSDDMFEPGALFNVAQTWKRHGGDVMVIGGCRELFPDRPSHVHFPRFQHAFDYCAELPMERVLDLKNHWLAGDFFYQPEVFFPKQVYDRVAGLDESLHLALDYDLWLRMAEQGLRVVVIDQVVAAFRFHDQQKTFDRKAVLKETVAVADRFLNERMLNLDPDGIATIYRSNHSLLRVGSGLVQRMFRLARRYAYGG